MRPLALRLTAARKAKGMTVSDVARQMPEVARSTVGHWFTGERQPQMDNLRRLAQILEVSAAGLVADEPDYASTSEERIGLQLLRGMTQSQRQAMLALMKSMSGPEDS